YRLPHRGVFFDRSRWALNSWSRMNQAEFTEGSVMKFSKTAMMVVAGGMLASTLVMAQQKATSERQAQFAIDTRQAVLTLLGSNMAPLAGMLKREIPYSQELVQKNASRLVQLAHMLPDTFMVDTSEIDIETEALDG